MRILKTLNYSKIFHKLVHKKDFTPALFLAQYTKEYLESNLDKKRLNGFLSRGLRTFASLLREQDFANKLDINLKKVDKTVKILMDPEQDTKSHVDIKLIFNRLDTAIERITEVSSSVNRMLAVHEEKIANQEEASIRANQEFTVDIRELHSRITTNYKELMDMIAKHHKEDAINQQKLRDDLNNRVGILEKWRWLIVGGSIVVGFLIHKFVTFNT